MDHPQARGAPRPRRRRRRAHRGASAALLSLCLALACVRSTPRTVPQAIPPSPAEPTPAPAAAPPQSAPVQVLPPLAPAPPSAPVRAPVAAVPVAGLTLRVGLATDLPRVVLPCCDGEVTARLGGVEVAVAAPIAVESAAAASGKPIFRLQVAALKDELQGKGLAERLHRLSGESADSRFDAATDLYRVRVGSYATREAAEAAGRRLQRVGVDSFWVVSEGAGVRQPALTVFQGGKRWAVPGRAFALAAAGEDGTIRVAGRRYRGRVEVFLNDRGTLNLINVVPLEQYLRGVVPDEMGPAVYDELEALKAQAVAARTYAARNLGEFAEEGYDICATPRCQVYGGVEDEHPLSDRAVQETAGEVLLFGGEPIDALYSSTCGGHTENVEVVFPLKQAGYLRGVPCLEAGVSRLGGNLPAGTAFPDGLTRALLPPLATTAGPSGASQLGQRLTSLAQLAGLASPPDRLASLERREVQRFLASLFDLAADARLFVAAEDLEYLLAHPPQGWSEAELRLAGFLVKSRLFAEPRASAVQPEESEALLFRLALYLHVLVEEPGTFLEITGGKLRWRVGGEVREEPLPGSLATFRDTGTDIAAADLALVPGDELRLLRRPGESSALALVQRIDPQGVAFDRSSSRAAWTRFRSDSELGAAVRVRYPGFELAGFEILSRGVSGRVGRLRLSAKSGESVDVEGLAVRWTLDLPDTLFTARRLVPAKGPAGWLFSGRGWGHGVGLCQVGSFGMARRGHDYRAILGHYYSGVTIGKLVSAPGSVASAPH